MWYNCGVDVDVLFEIDVDAESEEKALETAVAEALKRIKLPSSLYVASTSVSVAKDQSSGKVR